jgi:hypothetical protein
MKTKYKHVEFHQLKGIERPKWLCECVCHGTILGFIEAWSFTRSPWKFTPVGDESISEPALLRRINEYRDIVDFLHHLNIGGKPK